MPCHHILRPTCGCPQDAATAPQLRLAPDPAPDLRAPKKHPAGPGQPRSPWRVRYEQEQAARCIREEAEAELAEQIQRAVLDGKAQLVLDQLTGVLARHSLSAFCQAAWPVIEKSTRLQWGPHHDLLCTTLQALFEDWLLTRTDPDHVPAVLNTVINCPPGTLKSKIIAVFFPVWCWLRCPGMKFICLSVNETAAHRDARASRDIIKSDWFQNNFQPAWSLRGDQDAVGNYANNEGGGRLSQASGSVVVGLRGDCLLIDDANDPFATSKSDRETVNALWDDSQYSRVNDPVKSLRIGIQQRVHSDDWTGHVIAKQGLWSPANTNGWLHVVLPAEYEVSRQAFQIPHVLQRHVARVPGAVIRDWRTRPGEVLDPRRMTPEFLAGEKRRWAGTGNYAGQMQQRPSSEEGGKFKKTYFGWFRLAAGVSPLFDQLGGRAERPAGCHQGEPEVIHAATQRAGWDFDQIVLTVDPAVKRTESGSLWGMLAIGYRGARRYVLDDRSARGEPSEAIEVLKAMVRFWNPDRILIEDKGGGAGMIDTLSIEMGRGDVPMVLVEGVNPGTEDKELRANLALPTVANGMVFLLEGAEWVAEFVEELAGFPNFATNDRVDALTQVINHDRSDSFALPESDGWVAAGLG